MSDTVLSAPKPLIPAIATITRSLAPYGEPLVRVTTGLFLLPHSAQKLFGWFGGYGLDASAQFFATKLGLPASFALLASLIELVGGVLLILGLATRVAAGFIFAMMLVAVVTVHLPSGFFWMTGGYEYPLMWGILALSFVMRGGGRYSLDAAIGREV